MEELTKELLNPIWWITVVVAGIIINLIAAFLFKRMEVSISNRSDKFKNLSEKRKKERDARIQNLRDNKEAVYLTSLDEIRNRIRAVLACVLATLIFLMNEFFLVHLNASKLITLSLLFIASLLLFAAWLAHKYSVSILSEIHESQRS